jgi:hypothetical protein
MVVNYKQHVSVISLWVHLIFLILQMPMTFIEILSKGTNQWI